MSCIPTLKPQRGQSTIEFVVAALVLLPLLVAVSLLGRYLDLFQTTELASRYVAFEGIARHGASTGGWKSDEELGQEVRRRFYSTSDSPIKTGDVAGDFAAHRNPLWTNASGKPLIARFDRDVTVVTTVDRQEAIETAARFAGPLVLSRDNWYTGFVSVQIDGTDWLPALSTTRRTVLLTDAWTATNPTQIRDRIQRGGVAVLPIGASIPLLELVQILAPAVNDPLLRMGEHDWDVVPCDRLRPNC